MINQKITDLMVLTYHRNKTMLIYKSGKYNNMKKSELENHLNINGMTFDEYGTIYKGSEQLPTALDINGNPSIKILMCLIPVKDVIYQIANLKIQHSFVINLNGDHLDTTLKNLQIMEPAQMRKFYAEKQEQKLQHDIANSKIKIMHRGKQIQL